MKMKTTQGVSFVRMKNIYFSFHVLDNYTENLWTPLHPVARDLGLIPIPFTKFRKFLRSLIDITDRNISNHSDD